MWFRIRILKSLFIFIIFTIKKKSLHFVKKQIKWKLLNGVIGEPATILRGRIRNYINAVMAFRCDFKHATILRGWGVLERGGEKRGGGGEDKE